MTIQTVRSNEQRQHRYEPKFPVTFCVAFVVRMTIVPAVMTLMGKSAWYLPKWLDKILPNVDIEGNSLLKEVPNQTNKVKNKAI